MEDMMRDQGYLDEIGPRGWKGKITPYMAMQILALGFYTLLGYLELRDYGRYKADKENTAFFKTSADEILDCNGLDWNWEGTTSMVMTVAFLCAPLITVYIAFPLYYGTFNQIKNLVTFREDGRPLKFAGGYTVLCGIFSNYVGLRTIRCDMESITLPLWSIVWIGCLFLVIFFSALVVLGSFLSWGSPTCAYFTCFIRWTVILASVATFVGKTISTLTNLSFVFNFEYPIPTTLVLVSWVDTLVSLAVDLCLHFGGRGG